MPTCSAALEQTRNLSAQLKVATTAPAVTRNGTKPIKVHKDNRHDVHETLKSDLHVSSLVRGVQYNRKLTYDEIESFKEFYRALLDRPSSAGVENNVLARIFLHLNIYTSKTESMALVSLLPGSDTGMVSAEAVVSASQDPRIHQRNLLKRFIRTLPLTPINLDDMSVSTGSLRSSYR